MHVILGATGHVGSACAHALLDQGQAVTAVVHSLDQASPLKARGAEIAVVDIRDADALRAVFRRGRRAFLLNPPPELTARYGTFGAAPSGSPASLRQSSRR